MRRVRIDNKASGDNNRTRTAQIAVATSLAGLAIGAVIGGGGIAHAGPVTQLLDGVPLMQGGDPPPPPAPPPPPEANATGAPAPGPDAPNAPGAPANPQP